MFWEGKRADRVTQYGNENQLFVSRSSGVMFITYLLNSESNNTIHKFIFLFIIKLRQIL